MFRREVEHPPLAFISGFKVVVRNAAGSELEVFQDEQSVKNCPLSWSPDGRKIYHSYGQGLWELDSKGGEAQCLWTSLETESVSGSVKFGPTGELLFEVFHPTGSRLILFDPHSKLASTLYRGFQRSDYHSPTLPFIVQEDRCLKLIDLKGNQHKTLWQATEIGSFSLAPDCQRFAVADETGLSLICTKTLEVQIHIPGSLREPSWDGSGENLAYLRDDNELWILKGEETRLIAESAKPNESNNPYTTRPIWCSTGRFLFGSLAEVNAPQVNLLSFIADLKSEQIQILPSYYRDCQSAAFSPERAP